MGTFVPEGHQMEGNFLAGNMMPGASYGFLGLQGNMHMNQGSTSHPPTHVGFTMSGTHLQEPGHQTGFPPTCYDKADTDNISLSDNDEPSEDGIDDQNDPGKGKKGPQWHRMKWNGSTVKLLITAVSYVGEDAAFEYGGKRKCSLLQKKGKWSAISEVMTKRGYPVTPQQCEDKFNDLNKRYKKLTDILGRGTSCKIVANPALLDRMSNLSEKMKDDARKILSSKHLFYEEMCSYHNCNRLNLPEDPELQRSLHFALQSRDHDRKSGSHEDIDEFDQRDDSEDEECDHEEHERLVSYFPKRMKFGVNHEELDSHLQTQGFTANMTQVFPQGSNSSLLQEHCSSYQLQLEEKGLHIEAQMLELEKQRYKWQRFSKKKDRELNMMRMEIERMKLENERLSLELRKRELELDLEPSKTG